jgi:hypothetical protein
MLAAGSHRTVRVHRPDADLPRTAPAGGARKIRRAATTATARHQSRQQWPPGHNTQVVLPADAHPCGAGKVRGGVINEYYRAA